MKWRALRPCRQAGWNQAKKKAQQIRDAASGFAGDKRQAIEALTARVPAAEQDFVKTVAGGQGWEPIRFDPETAWLFVKEQMRALEEIGKQLKDSAEQQFSLTDPDARSMATSGCGTGTVGYNVQTAVDTEHHVNSTMTSAIDRRRAHGVQRLSARAVVRAGRRGPRRSPRRCAEPQHRAGRPASGVRRPSGFRSRPSGH